MPGKRFQGVKPIEIDPYVSPCDLRASLNHLATVTLDAEKLKAKQKNAAKPPPNKKKKTNIASRKAKVIDSDRDDEEAYHFIGYVPAHGKVWELDGLKSGPLEVGELPSGSLDGWMDVVRPALRMKMHKYGGSGNDGSNIRFSLLAIVDDLYQKASDDLEYLRRDKNALEKCMEPGWEKLVSFLQALFSQGNELIAILGRFFTL